MATPALESPPPALHEQPRPSRRLRTGAVVAAIATSAIALRFWKIDWGLSQGLWFPDEFLAWRWHLIAFVPLRLESFLPKRLVYPSLYAFAGGGATALAHAWGWIGDPAV